MYLGSNSTKSRLGRFEGELGFTIFDTQKMMIESATKPDEFQAKFTQPTQSTAAESSALDVMQALGPILGAVGGAAGQIYAAKLQTDLAKDQMKMQQQLMQQQPPTMYMPQSQGMSSGTVIALVVVGLAAFAGLVVFAVKK